GRPLGAVAGGQTIEVQILGRGNVPLTGVAAVVINVTVTGTTGLGYLTIFPTPDVPTNPPLASNLNWTAGKTIPNLVEVAVGANGRISIFNGQGSAAHVIVDVEGYVGVPTTTPGRDGRFVPTVPARVLDTRSGPAPVNAGLGPVPGGTAINVRVLGAGGVPASGVAAVVLNVTVTGPTSAALPTRVLDTRMGTADFGSPIGAMGPGATMSLPVAGRGGVPGMTAQRPPTAVVLNVTVTNPTVGDHLTIWPGMIPDRPLSSDLN